MAESGGEQQRQPDASRRTKEPSDQGSARLSAMELTCCSLTIDNATLNVYYQSGNREDWQGGFISTWASSQHDAWVSGMVRLVGEDILASRAELYYLI